MNDIPFERVIWTAQQCADYLRIDLGEFLGTFVNEPGFPAELSNAPGHWRAQEISDWALRPGEQQKPRPRRQATCVLYRHFDAEGTLLYVGISIQPAARIYQHDRTSHWFDRVRRIELEHFQTIAEAAAAERTAIQAENPRYNVRKR